MTRSEDRRWFRTGAALLALASAGCHLIFPFEVTPGTDADGRDGASFDSDVTTDGTHDLSRPGEAVSCKACWSGGQCVSGDTIQACGQGGGLCSACSVTSPCQKAACVSHSCSTANRPDGTACGGGKCYQGGCCTGCWSGKTCVAGSAVTACGASGEGCLACSSSNECQEATCDSSHQCSTKDRTNVTTACAGGDGNCLDGSCCKTCITPSSPSTCVKVAIDTACGSQGTPCLDCLALAAQMGSCWSGSCDGTACKFVLLC